MGRRQTRSAVEAVFANRLDVLNGLLELDESDEACDYLNSEIQRYRRLWGADDLVIRHWHPPGRTDG